MLPVFATVPVRFCPAALTYSTKTAFVMSLLTGQAAVWSLAITTQHQELMSDYSRFVEEMRCERKTGGEPTARPPTR